ATESATGGRGLEDTVVRDELLALDTAELQLQVVSYLQKELAKVTGLDISQLDPQQPVSSMNVDSLMAVELEGSLESRLGVRLPVEMLMEDPTITDIAAHIIGQLKAVAPAETVSEEPEYTLQEAAAGA